MNLRKTKAGVFATAAILLPSAAISGALEPGYRANADISNTVLHNSMNKVLVVAGIAMAILIAFREVLAKRKLAGK